MVYRTRIIPGLVLAGHLILVSAGAARAQQEPPAPPGEEAGATDLPHWMHGPVRGGPSARAIFEAAMDHLGAHGDEWYARHAGMVQAESSWRVRAESPWAQGLAQFTPPTRGDVWPRIAGCAGADPFDPWCGILAMDSYMGQLYRMADRQLQAAGATGGRPQVLAMARRGYNGGMGWQQRELRLCLSTPGCDPSRPDHMAAVCREAGRSEAACRENHRYAPAVARAEAEYRPDRDRRKRGLGRKILRGVAIGASVAQGRVPDLGR